MNILSAYAQLVFMKLFEQGQKKTGSCWLVEDQGLLLLAIHKLLARYVGSHDMRVRNMIFKPRQTMSFVFNLRIYPSEIIYCDLLPFFTKHFIKTLKKIFYHNSGKDQLEYIYWHSYQSTFTTSDKLCQEGCFHHSGFCLSCFFLYYQASGIPLFL